MGKLYFHKTRNNMYSNVPKYNNPLLKMTFEGLVSGLSTMNQFTKEIYIEMKKCLDIFKNPVGLIKKIEKIMYCNPN